MSWYRAIQDVPLEENTFFLAHEFFDALPVHQFQVLFFAFRLRSRLKSVTEVIALIAENSSAFGLGETGGKGCRSGIVWGFPSGSTILFCWCC